MGMDRTRGRQRVGAGVVQGAGGGGVGSQRPQLTNQEQDGPDRLVLTAIQVLELLRERGCAGAAAGKAVQAEHRVPVGSARGNARGRRRQHPCWPSPATSSGSMASTSRLGRRPEGEEPSVPGILGRLRLCGEEAAAARRLSPYRLLQVQFTCINITSRECHSALEPGVLAISNFPCAWRTSKGAFNVSKGLLYGSRLQCGMNGGTTDPPLACRPLPADIGPQQVCPGHFCRLSNQS